MTKKLTFQKLVVFGMAVLLTLSIAITAIALNNPAEAANEDNPVISTEVAKKFINVSGDSIIKVVPDLAYISVGVTSQNKDSQTALADNNKLTQAVIDSVKSFKVDSKDIQTGSFYISPLYNYDEKTGVSSIYGYTVSNTITVTVRNLDDLGKILDAAIKAGANNSTGVSFDFSKKSEKYLEALKLATENAKKEADAIASAFGGKNLTVVEITENSSNSVIYSSYNKGMEYSTADSSVPVEKGEISISASVAVKYTFE